MVDIWLGTKPLISGKRIIDHDWVANRIANAPYDFELKIDDGTSVLLELKSTNGPFHNRLYLSNGELNKMCTTPVLLARLYQLDEVPQLKIATETQLSAEAILSAVNFPESNVGLVSVWVLPEFFDFDEEIYDLAEP